MSQVKRYDIETDGFGNFSIGPDTSGRYVTYEDHSAMEQRLEGKYIEVSDCYVKMKTRMLAAEAKLAELNKQEAIFQVEVSGNHWLNAGPVDDSDFTALPDGINLLYSRPAPAVNLADLVPHNTCDACIHVLAVLGFNYKTARLKDVLSEVKRLRNIEEAKK